MKKRYGPITCQVCGKGFYPLVRCLSEAKARKTCSDNCLSKSLSRTSQKPRKKGKFYKCANCGKEIRDYPSRTRSIKFCNQGCQRAYEKGRHITKPCQGCGENFTISYARRYRKYCSQDCYLNHIYGENNPRWNGGRDYYYGANWIEQSEKARTRDDYTCQICGIHQSDYFRDLDVHHIIPFKTFGLDHYKKANKLSNLTTLCSSCHIKLENGKVSLGDKLPE